MSNNNNTPNTQIYVKMIKMGNTKMLQKEIKKNKKLLEIVDDKGSSLLHSASQEGNVEMVKMLLECGANINAIDKEKYTPVLEAASQKHFNVVKLLLDKNADPNMLNTGNSGILHYLIRIDEKSNDLNIQKQLIIQCCKMGANINMKNKFGETPLHQSIMRRSLEITQFLISQNADINKINKFGETGLHKAVILKDFDLVKFLLENGSDVKIESSRGTARELCDPVEDKNIFDLLVIAESNKVSDKKDSVKSTQRKSRYYDTWQRMKEMGGENNTNEIDNSGPSESDLNTESNRGSLRNSRSRSSSVIKENSFFNSSSSDLSVSSGSIGSGNRVVFNSGSFGSIKKKLGELDLDGGEQNDSTNQSIKLSQFYKTQKQFEDFDFPLLSEDSQFHMEMSGDGDFSDLMLIQINEYYKDYFYDKEHLNFLAVPQNDKVGNYGIISVSSVADKNDNLIVLWMTKDGYVKKNIPTSVFNGKKPLIEKILKWIQNEIKDFNFSEVYYVESHEIQDELLRIEALAPEKTYCFRIGVVYCKEDQKQEEDMFLNEPSPAFTDFLNVIGDKIDLMGWGGYRGQLCVTSPGESYYTEWNGLEIMFHVTTMMNAEQQRRLVGNDTAIIFFHESTSKTFNSSAPRSAMSQIFSVVQPRSPSHYKVSFLSRNKIKPYKPTLPKNPTFDTSCDEGKEAFRNFFLTKLVNGYRNAINSPPLDKMFKRPREAGIKQVVQLFPFKGKAKHKRKPKKK
eukprot:TRINITY_DN1080_c0_g6_i1.p1 TRINITY_DN1080_c0_g6~~TRINITY_DN1080_c0_g6_i1.p1  ORF type:complete len:739 (-),score=227.44 TRINITY_DN1080_c0_g6_i1:18-2234(-)